MISHINIKSYPNEVGIPHFCTFIFDFYVQKMTIGQFLQYTGCPITTFLCKTNPILSAVANSKSLCGKQLYHIYNFVESQKQTQFKPNFHPPKPWRRRTKPNLGNMGNIGYALEGGYIGGLLGFVVSFFFETGHLFGVFRHRLLGLVIFLRTCLRLFLFLLVRDVVVYAVSNPAYDNQRKSDY